MEPNNKITGDFSKTHFLKNLLVEYQQPKVYSLEEEFSKTKKNRDRKPYIIFFGFVFVLIGATFFTTRYMEVQSRQVKIDISDFEDLRLKETLQAAKEKEAELHQKNAELNNKSQELLDRNKELDTKKGEIRNLQNSFQQQVQTIREQVQDQADLEKTDKKALQRLEKKGQKQIDKIQNGYEAQLTRKQAEILKLQVQIKELEAKGGDLKTYQNGLGLYLKDKKAMGCIIDPRKRKNVIVFLPRDPRIAGETLVNLYRGDSDYAGQIKLISDGGGFRVELTDTSKGARPMDWFKMP